MFPAIRLAFRKHVFQLTCFCMSSSSFCRTAHIENVMTIEHVTYCEISNDLQNKTLHKHFSLWHSPNDWHLPNYPTIIHIRDSVKHNERRSGLYCFLLYHFHINIIFAVLTDTFGSDIQVMLCTTGMDSKLTLNGTHRNSQVCVASLLLLSKWLLESVRKLIRALELYGISTSV